MGAKLHGKNALGSWNLDVPEDITSGDDITVGDDLVVTDHISAVDIALSGGVGLLLTGTARVYKHLDITPSQFTQIAGGNPPAIGNQGVFGILLFDSGGTEEVFFNFHIPHDYEAGTDVKVQLFWAPTTNDSGKHVQWEVDWEGRKPAASAAGELLGAGSTNIELHDDTYAGAFNVQTTPEGTIAGASLDASDVIGMKVSRVIEAGDNYDGADAALLHLAISYTSNKLGDNLS